MPAQAHSRRWWVCPWFEPTKACKHKDTQPPISRRPGGCYFNFPLETTKCERCSLNELCDSTSSSSVSVSSTPLERSRIVCTCYRGTCDGGGEVSIVLHGNGRHCKAVVHFSRLWGSLREPPPPPPLFCFVYSKVFGGERQTIGNVREVRASY